MERQEFLKQLSLGMVAVCAGSCLASCGGSKASDPAPTTGTSGTTVDLSTKLLAVGDQVVVGSVLFFRIATGNTASSFVATEAVCPHQGGQLVWRGQQNLVQCQLHFAEYKSDGNIIQGPQGGGATRALKIYPVKVDGSTLSVTA